MNILLVNHYAGSPKHGMEYRPYYFAREWVNMGHEVTIVASSFSHLRTSNPIIVTSVTEENVDGIRYVWLKSPSYEGNNSLRVLNMLTFCTRLLLNVKQILKNRSPDLVIASSTYPLDTLPAYRIAKQFSAKMVFEVHDLWPLTPVLLGGMSPVHPFIFTLQWAEDFGYRKSDFVVSLLEHADSHMIARGMDASKFVYVPNGIDVGELGRSDGSLPPLHEKEFLRLWKRGNLVVGYTGGHGVSNALGTFIDAAPLLTDFPVTLILVGQGPEKEALKIRASQGGSENIVFLPPVPRESIHHLLSLMDVLYIGWKDSPLYAFGICPNKLLDYMAAGKPVIHGTASPSDIVAASRCGITIPPESPLAVANAVVQLINLDPEARAAMGRRGRDYVVTHHDYKRLARRFLEGTGLT
jgi:glycosyltransferase involved in cell wall biosynthesis